MSESQTKQKKIDSLTHQLKQALSQNVFFYYEGLKTESNEAYARQVVMQELNRRLDAFTQSGNRESAPGKGSLFSSLEELEKEYLEKNKHAIQTGDDYTRYDSEEVLGAIKRLKGAIE